jgi:hypothetical protein
MGDTTGTNDKTNKKKGSSSLRLLDRLLQIAAGICLVLLIALPLLALFSTDDVGVKFETPYSVCWGSAVSAEHPCPIGTHGGAVSMTPDGGINSFGPPIVNPDKDGFLSPTPTPSVYEQISITKSDTDSRVAYLVIEEAVLALLVVFFLALHRVVGSAREGEPFRATNVRRLRYAGVSVALLWVVYQVGARVLNHTLDRLPSYPNFHVTAGGPGYVFTLFVGVALLGLAEVFRAGTDLRDFEQAAI